MGSGPELTEAKKQLDQVTADVTSETNTVYTFVKFLIVCLFFSLRTHVLTTMHEEI